MTFGVRMGPDASPARWTSERRLFRRGTGSFYRKLQSIQFLVTRDREAVLAFLGASYPFAFPRSARLRLIQKFTRVTNANRGYHTLEEMLRVSDRIFRLAGRPGLTIVEAGTGSGSSTAKLSLAAQLAGGRVHAYDSFRGIPENEEQHELLDGRVLTFRKGAFRGRITSVKACVEAYGAPELCQLHKGLFADTLPGFQGVVDVVLLDVDLISSTRTCVTHLYPRLRPGGALFSQDGHLRATVDLFSDAEFWRSLGVPTPHIPGLGVNKMLVIEAPAQHQP